MTLCVFYQLMRRNDEYPRLFLPARVLHHPYMDKFYPVRCKRVVVEDLHDFSADSIRIRKGPGQRTHLMGCAHDIAVRVFNYTTYRCVCVCVLTGREDGYPCLFLPARVLRELLIESFTQFGANKQWLKVYLILMEIFGSAKIPVNAPTWWDERTTLQFKCLTIRNTENCNLVTESVNTGRGGTGDIFFPSIGACSGAFGAEMVQENENHHYVNMLRRSTPKQEDCPSARERVLININSIYKY